jgi:hypothetical protein
MVYRFQAEYGDAMELVWKLRQSLNQKYKDKTKHLRVRFGLDCVVVVLFG